MRMRRQCGLCMGAGIWARKAQPHINRMYLDLTHARMRRRVTPPDSRLTRTSEARAAQGWRTDALSYSREELQRDPGVYLIR